MTFSNPALPQSLNGVLSPRPSSGNLHLREFGLD